MRDDDHKKIGSATYLKKSTGLYIPFWLKLDGTNCDLIQPMLDKADQDIWFINKDNKN